METSQKPYRDAASAHRAIVATRWFALLAAFALATSCATFPRAGVDRIRRVELTSETLPASLDGYRVAFVSDVHLGNNFAPERLRALVAAVNAERPDCAILGGDYTRDASEIADFANAAGAISARDGVYAVLGNHDHYWEPWTLAKALRGEGIVILEDIAITTPRGLTVAGIDNLTDEYPDLSRFRDTLPESGAVILVSHTPDFAEESSLAPYRAMLSGHTHGGQITIFGYAPVIPSRYGQKYRTGTVTKDGTPVIVSNGAGFSGETLRFRLFAPSDFLLITLRSRAPTKPR
jgi:uncharacterized protein